MNNIKRLLYLRKIATAHSQLFIGLVIGILIAVPTGMVIKQVADKQPVPSQVGKAPMAQQPKVVAKTDSTTSIPPQNTNPTAATTPTSTSGAAAEAALSKEFAQAAQLKMCKDFYSNTLYTYNTGVSNLAIDLGNEEDEVYKEGTQQGWTFNAAITNINSDIANKNGVIRSDWNLAFVTSKPSGDCGAPPTPPALLQVPSCDAQDYGGISDCISQINTSLGI